MSQLQTRHSGFWRWLIALSVACLVVFSADIYPAIRLLDFVAILTTFAVCVLSFALIFTDVRTALLGSLLLPFVFRFHTIIGLQPRGSNSQRDD